MMINIMIIKVIKLLKKVQEILVMVIIILIENIMIKILKYILIHKEVFNHVKVNKKR